MTRAQRRLLVAVLAAAGPLAWAAWRWATTDVIESSWIFSGNPDVSPEGDEYDEAMQLVALHDWLNRNTVGIGVG